MFKLLVYSFGFCLEFCLFQNIPSSYIGTITIVYNLQEIRSISTKNFRTSLACWEEQVSHETQRSGSAFAESPNFDCVYHVFIFHFITNIFTT